MRRLLPLLFTLICGSLLWADATLFVQEPYGFFGSIVPTGHAAVYLSRVCAQTPVLLRRCRSGETGIVISRYRNISGYDWIAIPLIPYLYAVEHLESVPEAVNSETVAFLRDEYRRKHLQEVVPDRAGGQAPKGSWRELVGAAYNRRIYAFQVETSDAQDDHLISMLNSRKNRNHFNLFFNNCADFSRWILGQYYPTAIRRNFLGDAGISTPLQIARSLVSYSKRNRDFSLSAYFIPQILGDRKPSHKARGVAGSVVRSKKYILPLATFHPFIAAGVVAVYLARGRFNLARYAETARGPLDVAAMQESSGGENTDPKNACRNALHCAGAPMSYNRLTGMKTGLLDTRTIVANTAEAP